MLTPTCPGPVRHSPGTETQPIMERFAYKLPLQTRTRPEEKLVVKAFWDMGANARLQRLKRERFVAGHENCALRQHLDNFPPETPIRDIVDQCRVRESHTDTGVWIIVKPVRERALPVYTVDEPACVPADRVVAAVTATPAGPSNLEALLWHLLPTNDTAHPAEICGVRDFAEMTTVRSAGPMRTPACFRGRRLWPLGRDRVLLAGIGLR